MESLLAIFPQFLAFDEFALMTHHNSAGGKFPVTRRSVLVAPPGQPEQILQQKRDDAVGLQGLQVYPEGANAPPANGRCFSGRPPRQQHHCHVRWEWGPFGRPVCLRGFFGALESQRA